MVLVLLMSFVLAVIYRVW